MMDSQYEKEPTTPRKRTKKTTDADADDDGTPSKKTNNGTPSKRSGLFGSVPASYEEAGAEDKKLIYMRDAEGRGFSEIQEVLEEITGVKIGSSSIRNRYYRMKSNFVMFEEKDVPVLLRVKKEIEDKFELEKWQKIANGIESETGNKYPATAIRKKFKDVSKGGNDISAE